MVNIVKGRKKTLSVLMAVSLFIILSLVVAGCGSQPSGEKTVEKQENETSQAKSNNAQSSEKPAELPSMVSIGTHQTGSTVYATGVAFADVITKNTPMKAVVEAGPGPSQWLPLMRKGEVQFGIANQVDAYAAYTGTILYQEKTDLRVVKIGNQLIKIGFLVRDAAIKEVADLKGKRVSYGDAGQKVNDLLTEAYLANAGLTIEDIVAVPANGIGNMVKNVTEGRADASLVAVGSAIAEEFLSTVKGARWLSLNANPSDEILKKMREIMPNVLILELKPGSSTGIEKPINVLTYDNYLMAPVNLSEEVVYAIAETLYNNFDQFKDAHPTLPSWGPGYSVAETTIPFHPGAIKFYKKIGIWTKELDEYQKTVQ